MRFLPVSTETGNQEAVAVLNQSKQVFGMVPNLLRYMAIEPRLADAYLHVTQIFAASSLSEKEQNLVLLTASAVQQCRYCLAAYTMLGKQAGLTDAQIDRIKQGQPLDDPKLEALRGLTVNLIDTRGQADSAVLVAVEQAGYGPEQVLAVVLGISLKVMSNYTNHLAGTPIDDAFQPQ
ncbi:carboxymuconolactone decarboxylase family protein [Hydrogenovibrio halophilus]|uniref:carboxymuconolactone decarboxylase family protein n=1 Tax=Hydrogenovibrio halophilus TaxID=373391 RepID=UPI000368AEFC|nr:carboxymuconolactone decarboxylase family protein [Hydrogenovibrio halophilus]